MKLSDEVLEDLTRWATFSADTVAMEQRALGVTNAQVTRRVVRRAIEALAANDLIRVPDLPTNSEKFMYVPDPPFDPIFGPERRPVINKFHNFEPIEVTDASSRARDAVSRSENKLCECDRPDQRDEPHRHTLDVACVYWMAGRPSVEDRVDAMRQLNVERVEV